jgi:serine/threonine protein kinase
LLLLKKLYIITELCEAGELAKWLKKNGPMKEDKSKIIMRKIVDAISYLHKNGVFFFLCLTIYFYKSKIFRLIGTFRDCT